MILKNKIIIGVSVIVVAAILVVAMMIPGKEDEPFEEKLLNINYDVQGNDVELSKYDTVNPVVAMYIEKYGSVVMELYPEIAPNTVNSFISLVRSGFYDNNTFHRLAPGFVLQGGDPEGTGNGGPGYAIKGEFTNNGFENNLKHEKGIVSMARASYSMDTAGSQFFIMLGTADYLDGNYAAFGKVIDGMDIVEEIEKREKVADSETGKLQTNLVLKKALVDTKGVEYPEPEKIEE